MKDLFKILSVKEWALSHVFLVGGLVLVTVGMVQGLSNLGVALIIIGMWVGALGLCLAFGYIFKKLIVK